MLVDGLSIPLCLKGLLDLLHNQWSQLLFVHLYDELKVALSDGLFNFFDLRHVNSSVKLVKCKRQTERIFEELEDLLVIIHYKFLLNALNDLLEQYFKVSYDDDGELSISLNV
jgi:hypothetical protein